MSNPPGGSLINIPDFSAPLSKLIETVGSAVGATFEPMHIRRKAAAEADRTRELARADEDVKDMTHARKLAREERAYRSLLDQELFRQEIRESIAEQAIHQLPEHVNREKVEPDWVTQFWSNAQDVTDETMQLIWAKMLAGEVASPGTFSLRTLEVVRTLRKQDAELFQRFCNLLWTVNRRGYRYVVVSSVVDKWLENHGINFEDLLNLESLGLISMQPGFGFDLDVEPPFVVQFDSDEEPMIIVPPTGQFGMRLIVRMLTQTGYELKTLATIASNYEYRDIVIDDWVNNMGLIVHSLLRERSRDAELSTAS